MIIDVSEHNGVIDWNKVKPQIEGAIIRVGYGQDLHKQDDNRAAANISACEVGGIPYGVYLYSYADTMDKVQGEINHMRRIVDRLAFMTGHGPTMGIWYDLEEYGCRCIWTDAAKAWVKAFGPDGGVYMSAAYADKYIPEGYRKWVAAWGKNTGDIPAAKTCPVNAEIWQYTSKGRIDGIYGYVDLNMYVKTSAAKDYRTVDDLIDGICRGDFGNGSERKDALYKYLQDKVNRRYKR